MSTDNKRLENLKETDGYKKKCCYQLICHFTNFTETNKITNKLTIMLLVPHK